MRFFYKFYCLFFVLILSASLLQGCGDAFEQSEIIIAEIENCYTKTWYDGDGINQKVKWELGDTIKVNNQLLVAKELSDGDKKAYFYPADGGKLKIKSPFVAVYPHTIMEGEEIAISKSRRLSEENFGNYYGPMYAKGESSRLLFRNICGVIGLRVKGEESITGMKLTSGSGAMAGSVTVEDGMSAVSQEFSNAGVEYEFEHPFKLSKKGDVFYFAVPPREYNVIKVFMTTTDGRTADYKLEVNEELKRNQVTMYEIEPEFEENPFKDSPSPKGAITCAIIDGKKKMIEFSPGWVFYNFGDYMTTYDFHTADIYMNDNQFWLMQDMNSYCIVDLPPWHAFSGKETKAQRKKLDYSIFSDAGQYFGDGKTWFTLSADEWDFIFNDTRRGSRVGDCEHARFFFSTVQHMSFYNKLSDYLVVAVLPDTFDWPSGIKEPVNINNPYENFTNYYTYEELKELDRLGIVILKFGYNHSDKKDHYECSFWSSTSCDDRYAYCITITTDKGINTYHRIIKGDYSHYEDYNSFFAYISGLYTYPRVRLVKMYNSK